MFEMHTLGEMGKMLNRSAVYLSGLQTRFELPVFEGAGYSDAYFAFLRTLVYLRALSISEETLRDLWRMEKKLLQLLHIDSSGSPIWFLDACGAKAHRNRRLLLTNYDMGVEVSAMMLQPGLDFSVKLPELFAGKEMGEDALRVLKEYLKVRERCRSDIAVELPLIRAGARWAAPLRA